MTLFVPPGSFIFKSAAIIMDIIVVIVSGKLHATVNRKEKVLDIKQPVIISIFHWDRHTHTQKKKPVSLECNVM